MTVASTRVKLGLFAVLAAVGLVASAVALGVRELGAEGVPYHAYFDESVQGLEIGSPVKYRGVTVGSVAAIGIAPDQRHVDVMLSLRPKEIASFGLKEPIAPELRAQLASQGITGVKLVDIDFFDPRTSPTPALPFATPKNTVPTKTSTLKGLEDELEATVDRLPALIDVTIATLEKTGRILDDLDGARIPRRVGMVIDGVAGAVTDLRAILRGVDRAKLPDRTAEAMDALGESIGKVNLVLDRVAGDAGLLASTQRATENLGDLGRAGARSSRDLDRTMRDLDEAARAIRDLAQSIERDPDMLVKGHAKENLR